MTANIQEQIATERRVEYWEGGGQAGYRVEFYREDAQGIGECAYWYGTQADCLIIRDSAFFDTNTLRWQPVRPEVSDYQRACAANGES